MLSSLLEQTLFEFLYSSNLSSLGTNKRSIKLSLKLYVTNVMAKMRLFMTQIYAGIIIKKGL